MTCCENKYKSTFADGAAVDASLNLADSAVQPNDLLDSPLMEILTKNKKADRLSGSLSIATSASSVINRYGSVSTVAANDIGQESSGWLFEGESTNFALYPQDFSNAVWQPLVGAVKTVIPSLTNPDGTTQTTGFEFNASGQVIRQALSTDSTNKTISFYLYVRDKSGVTQLNIDYGDGVVFIFDLTSINTNEWAKVIAPNLSKGAGDFIGISINQSPTTAIDFSLYNGQIEPLSFATSSIYGTTTAVTRQNNDTTFNVFDNAPNLASNWKLDFSIDSQTNTFTLLGHDGSSFAVSFQSGNLVVTNPAGTSYTLASSIDVSTLKKYSISYNGSNLTASIDGVNQSPVAATFTTISSGNIQVGNNTALTDPMFGHIDYIKWTQQ